MNLENIRECEAPRSSELVIVRPENSVSPVPILLAPGFANNAESYSGFMQQMSRHGRTIVCPNYDLNDRRRLGIFPDVNAVKEEALLSAIQQVGFPDEKGIPVVDAIAHSLGGIDLILIARKHPENFRSIVLLATNGLHPKMGIIDSVKRLYIGEKTDSIDRNRLAQQDPTAAGIITAGKEFSKTHRQKITTIFPEVRRAGFQTIQQYFPELRAAGVKIIITRMLDDSRFLPTSYDPYVNQADETISLPGIHADVKYRPSFIAQELSDLLSHQNLDRNRSLHAIDSKIQ